MGVISVSEMCEMSLGGLEGTSILAVLAVIVVLSSVDKYTKIASFPCLHSLLCKHINIMFDMLHGFIEQVNIFRIRFLGKNYDFI